MKFPLKALLDVCPSICASNLHFLYSLLLARSFRKALQKISDVLEVASNLKVAKNLIFLFNYINVFIDPAELNNKLLHVKIRKHKKRRIKKLSFVDIKIQFYEFFPNKIHSVRSHSCSGFICYFRSKKRILSFS